MNRFKGVALVLLCLATHREAWGDEYRLKLIPHPNLKEVILNLKWDEGRDTQEPELQIREKEKEGLPYFVKLQGKFQEKDRTLLYENQPIAVASDGGFSIEVGVDSERNEFVISEVDEAGKLTNQTSQLLFPEWKEFLEAQGKKPEKKWSFQAGTGIAAITYSQTGGGTTANHTFTELGLNLQAGARYQWKDYLAFAGQSSFTALPIGVGPSGNTIRFLNLSAQVIYPLRFIHTPWKLELLANYSYLTTLPSQSSFGYTNVQGVTIFPRLERELSGEKKLWGSIRFMPISGGGITFLSPSSYEFNFQAGFQGIKLKNHWIDLTLDINLFSLQYTAGSAGSIQSNSYTLGANYLF